MNEEGKISEKVKPRGETRTKRKSAGAKMLVRKRVLEIKEDKTVKELMDELQLASAPVLLEVNGEVFRPDRIKDRKLGKGDKVALLPVIVGG
jgi:thiamine biosynthesis protein ThiS